MRVAIMQPTYLPWSGYFGLMRSVDLFIFLDSVQFARRSWQQRNQIKTANGPQWLTIPVLAKGKRDCLISEMEIDQAVKFTEKHKKSIELNYKKTPYFKTIAPELLPYIDSSVRQLADLTIGLTLCMRDLLGITVPVLRSSELQGEGSKAELLASLCEEVGATEYIAVPGSRNYLEMSDAFLKIGISVRYFEFNHPQYSQMFGGFSPYMSCIDMLFNCGAQSLSLIDSGCEVS